MTYAYDELGRVTSRLLNGTGTTTAYDALGRVSTLTHAIGTFTYGYVGNTGRVQSLAYPNAQMSAYAYLPNAQDRRLQTIHHTASGGATLSKFDYTYDAVGNIQTWRQERVGQTPFVYRFSYDAADQLVSAVKQSTDPTPTILKRQAWAYDVSGNRTVDQNDDAVFTTSHDAMNRLGARQAGGLMAIEGTTDEPATVTINGRPARGDTANVFRGTAATVNGTSTFAIMATDVSGNQTTQEYEVDIVGATTSYTHDANGNLTGDGTKSYEWNALDQLVRVTEGGVEIASFVYDGLGRRAQKAAGGVTRAYVYDAEDIVEERQSSGDVTRFVHGPGIDNMLARTTNGTHAIGYLADHLGSIVQETNALGQVELTREYDAWGNAIQGKAVGGFAYSGREWDGRDPIPWTSSERRIRCPRWQRQAADGPVGDSQMSSSSKRSAWCSTKGAASRWWRASWT